MVQADPRGVEFLLDVLDGRPKHWLAWSAERRRELGDGCVSRL
ncbi:hypothetical protein ACIQ9Q_25055 [Streptomyces sp. NPDC094438]